MQRILRVLLAGTLVASLAGCTVDGLGRSVENTGRPPSPSQGSGGAGNAG